MLHLLSELQDLKSAGQNPKGVLNNPSPVALTEVEDPLIQVHASAEEGFHHPGSEGEGINNNHEVLYLNLWSTSDSA